jgi:hypothetical protein
MNPPSTRARLNRRPDSATDRRRVHVAGHALTIHTHSLAHRWVVSCLFPGASDQETTYWTPVVPTYLTGVPGIQP